MQAGRPKPPATVLAGVVGLVADVVETGVQQPQDQVYTSYIGNKLHTASIWLLIWFSFGIVKKEDLDKELDQYMVNTKAINDLDHLMI